MRLFHRLLHPRVRGRARGALSWRRLRGPGRGEAHGALHDPADTSAGERIEKCRGERVTLETCISHSFTVYTHTDTTHTLWCAYCGAEGATEAHTFVNGVCVCGAQAPDLVLGEIQNQTYDGAALTPALTVTNGSGDPLTAGTDYTVSYEKDGAAVTELRDAGTYTVIITGAGNYADSLPVRGSFTIEPVKGVTVTITGHSNTVTYDSDEHIVTGYDVRISNPHQTQRRYVCLYPARRDRDCHSVLPTDQSLCGRTGRELV